MLTDVDKQEVIEKLSTGLVGLLDAVFKTKIGMCGRYSFVPTKQQIETDLDGIILPIQLNIRFNIAPTQLAYVIANDKPHVLQEMVWGLVPGWSKDGTPNGKMINARAEGIEDKPSFRDPIRRRRCLVPADSFYEWRTEAGNKKMPYRIFDANGHMLMMAGIWDEWGYSGKRFRTVSIITTTPNKEMELLHNRMPVLFDKVQAKAWLQAIPLEAVLSLLHPPPDGLLRMYRVSEKLNYAGFESPELHQEIPESPLLF